MSLSDKTKKWLLQNCDTSLKGKTVVITGANSGVGFKMTETMVYLGACVIMACRNMSKANAAKDELLREYPDADIIVMKLDMADFSSIDSFADAIISCGISVDAFVNNAGVFHQPNKKTANGFDLVIGTNYIGVYYLSEKLLPYLKTLGKRVYYINTVSMIHKIARVDYDDFYYEKRYGKYRVYARAKLCLARYTYALAKRYGNTNVRVLMNHPGIALTPLEKNAFKISPEVIDKFGGLFNSPEKSSLSLAYIMSRDIPSGSLIGPEKGFGGWGYPKYNHVYRNVRQGAEPLIRFTEKEIKEHTT